MKKIILSLTLISTTLFGKATNLMCEWKDPASGVQWAALQLFPFPVPPPSVIPIEALENITGATEEKSVSARYVTLNVDATPSSFPLGVYVARDPRDVTGTAFPPADTIELRVTELTSKQGTPPVIDSVSKGTLKRTTHAESKTYPVICRGMLIQTRP